MHKVRIITLFFAACALQGCELPQNMNLFNAAEDVPSETMQARAPSPALERAAAHCDAISAEAALASGANPNAAGPQGSTPLSLAVTRAITLTTPSGSSDDPCLQTVQLLLAAGGDPTLPGLAGDKSPLLHTALSLATMYQRYAAFGMLASTEGNRLNDLIGEFGETPLVIAVRYRDPALVRVLLASGAKADQKDANGDTPLSAAKSNVDSERMKMLGTVGVTRTQAHADEIVRMLEQPAL